MKKFKKLVIACDGESASGKSTAAKLISKKYGLLLVNSGLLYRYASKLVIDHKPKNEVEFLRKKFEKVSYKKISKLKLHSEKISNHVAILAKNKVIRDRGDGVGSCCWNCLAVVPLLSRCCPGCPAVVRLVPLL